MPFNYAHYRFGVDVLESMPGDIRRTAKRFRRLYDVGLHGPDPFFYYTPLPGSKLTGIGRRMHRLSGREFFARVCRSLRMEPSPAAEAYLYGVLCHYVLDAVCHPFVWEQVEEGTAEHGEIETEFDRFLLESDGKIPPQRQDLSPHLRLEPEDCGVVARFYPGVTAKVVDHSLRNMVLATKALAAPGDRGRQLLTGTLGLVGNKAKGFIMTQEPNPRCSHLNLPLLERYETAREQFPERLLQLNAHLTYNAPLGEEFTANFG